MREIDLCSPGAEGGDEPPPRPRRFRFKGRCPSGRAGRSRKTRAARPLRRILGPPHAVPGSRRRVPRHRDPLSPARPFRSGLPDPGRLTPALLAPLPLFLQPDRRPSAHPSRCRRPDPQALNVGSLHPPLPAPTRHLPAPGSFPPWYPGSGSSAVRTAHRPGFQSLDPGVPSCLPRTPPSWLSAPALCATTLTRTSTQPLLAVALRGCPASDLEWGGTACAATSPQVASPLWAWPGVWLGPSGPRSRCSSESPRRRRRPRTLDLGEVPGGSSGWSRDGGAGLRGLGGAPCRAGPGARLSTACTRVVSTRALSVAASRCCPTFKWDTQLWPGLMSALPRA